MCKLCYLGMLRTIPAHGAIFSKEAVAFAGRNSKWPQFVCTAACRGAIRSPTNPPQDSCKPGRRYVIRGGMVMSMDPAVGHFVQADVLVEGKTILAIAPHVPAGTADVIDASGRIVMPGFIDTHHHQFETALRSFLADGVLISDPNRRAERQHDLLRIRSAQIRPSVPAAGRLHQRAICRTVTARRRRHDGARRVADSLFPGSLGCRRPGAV